MENNIFDYVTTEINNYQTGPGPKLAGNWYRPLYKHFNYSFLMKNGQFPKSQSELGERPKKNIIYPIIKLAHRTEGFDAKDIEAYVDNSDFYHLSFFARKFYHRWAENNHLDTFIDQVIESQDYGVTLVKNEYNKVPRVIKPYEIAFCDQTNILGGTICLRNQYSIDEFLRIGEESGWDTAMMEYVVSMSRAEKSNGQLDAINNKTPNISIEVFEVHGVFPKTYLKKNLEYSSNLKAKDYSRQLHLIVFVKDENGNKNGVTLYKGTEDELPFKSMVLEEVEGSAVGRGRVEMLFEPQVWTDFNMIHMQNMLKNASKVVHVTTDPDFDTKNDVNNLKGGEFLKLTEGRQVNQLNTQPINIGLFDRASQEWEQHARILLSASDPALGLAPVSGTPLGTTEIVTQQGEGIHEYNRGKFAQFIYEIHMDWILQAVIDDMNKGHEWLQELSLDEMQYLSDVVGTNVINKKIKEAILNGNLPPENIDALKEQFKVEFNKSNKKFLKILKDEFKDLKINLNFNVAGKQKDLGRMVEKLTNIWRTIFANPQGFMETMKIPGAAESFNSMLEYSGLKQINFSAVPEQVQPQQQPQQGLSQPSPVNPQELLVNSQAQ